MFSISLFLFTFKHFPVYWLVNWPHSCEKNNNVKHACHKSIREGIICLFSLPSLKYLFSAAILSIKEMLSVSIGTTIGQ